MNEEHYWKATLEELKQGNSAVLIVIIERIGSAPNIPGAKMFITLNDSMGTVGGGNSEHRLYSRAKNLIEERQTAVEKIHLEHSDTTHETSSGMICSGSQRFALVTLGEKDIVIIQQIIESVEKAKPGVLSIDDNGINFEIEKTLTDDRIYTEEGVYWCYQENLGIQNKLFIIGGGHVSLALSRLMNTLGFHITVIDDRENLPTMNNNKYAHKKIVESYENIEEFILEGDSVYVTIMTYGHISDEYVLERLISKRYRYLGMMASSSKKQQVFSNLKNKGVPESLLKTVHSPIGLKIKSHTPEEIAVSIAAEIIRVKNT